MSYSNNWKGFNTNIGMGGQVTSNLCEDCPADSLYDCRYIKPNDFRDENIGVGGHITCNICEDCPADSIYDHKYICGKDNLDDKLGLGGMVDTNSCEMEAEDNVFMPSRAGNVSDSRNVNNRAGNIERNVGNRFIGRGVNNPYGTLAGES